MTIQNVQSGYGNATVEYTRKAISTEESYRQILEQKMSEADEVIRNGSTEKAIPLGGDAYTAEEWDELLANFDATMDDLREQMRAEHTKQYEEKLQEISNTYSSLSSENKITISEVNVSEVQQMEMGYTEFATTKYDVIPNDESGCYDVYNKTGEKIGSFYYEDMVIYTDAVTGTQLLISEHGTAAYDAMVLDHELITGFQKSMGIDSLSTDALAGYTLHTHAGTGIRYLVKAGDEGRGGHLLLSSDEERAAIEQLADKYLQDYPNLVSNREVAQINAVLEVVGLMERTPNGILSINRDGMSYNDNSNFEKNWALLFKGAYYENAFDFMKLHQILGTDMSNYSVWNDFFKENEIEIERIWSDQELEQGYLNN